MRKHQKFFDKSNILEKKNDKLFDLFEYLEGEGEGEGEGF